MPTLRGGCHCGKVAVAFDTDTEASALQPRACDCPFCRKHGAAWLSDASGALCVDTSDGVLRDYRQGSGQARFLLCGECGVVVAVVLDDGNGILGAVNAMCLDEAASFAPALPVSPQTLAAADKRARWQQLWTPATIRIERPLVAGTPTTPSPAHAGEGWGGVQ